MNDKLAEGADYKNNSSESEFESQNETAFQSEVMGEHS